MFLTLNTQYVHKMTFDTLFLNMEGSLPLFPVIVAIISFVMLCALLVFYYVAYRRSADYVNYFRTVVLPSVDQSHVYREFIELSTDICIRYDRMGVCTYANPAMVEMTGVWLSKMTGKRSIDFTMLDDPAFFNREVTKVIGGGEGREFDTGFIDKSGRINLMHIRLVPEITVTGNFNGVIAIGREVVSMREIEWRMAKRSA
jgi:PAS domain S-box-containing protein